MNLLLERFGKAYLFINEARPSFQALKNVSHLEEYFLNIGYCLKLRKRRYIGAFVYKDCFLIAQPRMASVRF